MIAMIELAKNKSSIDEMRSMLTGMEKNTHKTLHLAEQFLQLARANASENINFYDIDFNSVVLNAIDQLWALSNKMQVSITPSLTVTNYGRMQNLTCWNARYLTCYRMR